MINDDFYMIGGLSDNGPCTDVMKVKFSRSAGEYDMCNENLANKVPKSETIEAFAGLNISWNVPFFDSLFPTLNTNIKQYHSIKI